jgi:hypothetical protein
MTLDAGGTNFVFSAIERNRAVVESFALPSYPDHLERSLNTIVEGFRRVRAQLAARPVAISFAFSRPGGLLPWHHRRPAKSAGLPQCGARPHARGQIRPAHFHQ